MNTAIKKRVMVLEDQAGIRDIDAERLAVLDKDDADFYQGVARAVAHHKGGFESFVKTLADDEIERLTEIEIRLTDDADCRADLVEALARRQERHKRDGL